MALVYTVTRFYRRTDLDRKVMTVSIVDDEKPDEPAKVRELYWNADVHQHMSDVDFVTEVRKVLRIPDEHAALPVPGIGTVEPHPSDAALVGKIRALLHKPNGDADLVTKIRALIEPPLASEIETVRR